MKKIIIYPALITTAITLLNGCIVMKRKHRPGLYIESISHASHTNQKDKWIKENTLHSKTIESNLNSNSNKDMPSKQSGMELYESLTTLNVSQHSASKYTSHDNQPYTNTLKIDEWYKKIIEENSKHIIRNKSITAQKIKPVDDSIKAIWEKCGLKYETVLRLVLLFGYAGAHYWYARKYLLGCLNTFIFMGVVVGLISLIISPGGLILLLFYGIPDLIWWGIDVNRVKDGSFKPECNYEYRTPSTPSTTTPKSEPNTIEYSTPPKTIIGTGTGFFITNDVIVTNHHVIENAYYLYIYDKDSGKEYPLYVIAKDINNDLALLKSPEFKKDNIPFSISEKDVRTGDEVFTIGYPEAQYLGIEPKFADGKVSALTGFKDNAAEYQLTVPVHPGNSGSALFNKDGEIIGVINAKFTKGENVSYAIKKEALHNLLKLNNIHINTNNQLQNKSLQDKIDIIKKYTYIILIKQ